MNRRTFFKTLIIGGLATISLPEKVFSAPKSKFIIYYPALPFPFDFLPPDKYRLVEKDREVFIYSREYNNQILHLTNPLNEINWYSEYHGIPLWREMRNMVEYEIEMSEGARKMDVSRATYFYYKFHNGVI